MDAISWWGPPVDPNACLWLWWVVADKTGPCAFPLELPAYAVERVAKVLQFLSGLVILIEVVGRDRIETAGQWLGERRHRLMRAWPAILLLVRRRLLARAPVEGSWASRPRVQRYIRLGAGSYALAVMGASRWNPVLDNVWVAAGRGGWELLIVVLILVPLIGVTGLLTYLGCHMAGIWVASHVPWRGQPLLNRAVGAVSLLVFAALLVGLLRSAWIENPVLVVTNGGLFVLIAVFLGSLVAGALLWLSLVLGVMATGLILLPVTWILSRTNLVSLILTFATACLILGFALDLRAS